jgi:hypothetical protein
MYQYYVDEKNNEVIAVTRYAGRNVRGTAKCAPEDEFNLEVGKDIAEKRCELKKAKIKCQNASEKYLIALENFEKAKKRFFDMRQYYMDAVDQYDEAYDILEKALNVIE